MSNTRQHLKGHRYHREKTPRAYNSFTVPTKNFLTGKVETGRERARHLNYGERKGYLQRSGPLYAWWGYCTCGWSTGPHEHWQTCDSNFRDHIAHRKAKALAGHR